MVRDPVHWRFATKTATQRPELHDHKIILVLRHLARFSFPLHPRSPPSPDCSTRELVTNERDEGDVTTVATCRAVPKARKSTATSYKRLTANDGRR